MSDYNWLDKYIAEQKAAHGRLADLISEVAEAIELYGDDELERLALALMRHPEPTLKRRV